MCNCLVIPNGKCDFIRAILASLAIQNKGNSMEIFAKFDKTEQTTIKTTQIHFISFVHSCERMCEKKSEYIIQNHVREWTKTKEKTVPIRFPGKLFLLNIKILWFDSIMQTVQVIKTLIGYVECINKALWPTNRPARSADPTNQRKTPLWKQRYEWMNDWPINLIN